MKWYLSNHSTLLERIRQALAISERPDQLYAYSGVMPVYDVAQLMTGALKTVNLGTVTVGGVGVNANNMAAAQMPQSGKRWRIIAIGAFVSTSNASTLTGMGWSRNQSGTYIPLSIPVSVSAATLGVVVGTFVPGTPVVLTDTDPLPALAVWCSAFTSAPVVSFSADVIEENSVTQ